jgi:hypothetical protein
VDELRTIAEHPRGAPGSLQRGAPQRRNLPIRQESRAGHYRKLGQIKERVEGIAENILALSEQTQQMARSSPP